MRPSDDVKLKCPWRRCESHARWFPNATFLARHIEAHATEIVTAAAERRDASPEVSEDLEAPRGPRVIGKLRRFLMSRPREEVLALDWSRTNVALARELGWPDHRVGKLRELLRAEGHPIPRARRGPRGGRLRARERYIQAGLGTVPDRVVAEALGVSKQAVHAMRVALGLPALANRRTR